MNRQKGTDGRCDRSRSHHRRWGGTREVVEEVDRLTYEEALEKWARKRLSLSDRVTPLSIDFAPDGHPVLVCELTGGLLSHRTLYAIPMSLDSVIREIVNTALGVIE